MSERAMILAVDDLVLITGANGFIGSRVVASLLDRGFQNLRCFVRPTSNLTALNRIVASSPGARVEVMSGNLLSRDDCAQAVDGVSVVLHLAAGIEKTFPGSFMNSVVTTRNLLDAVVGKKGFRRFLNVSSFAVYSNLHIKRGGLLDESCEIESRLVERFEPYVFSKVKQDAIVLEYARKHNVPYVIVRPGAVYGPGKNAITPRVGIDTFGFFLHLGGRNTIPLSYVANCADAIVAAGVTQGIDGEVFNIVDDDLPTSRQFLRLYKKNARSFRSVYIPHGIFYFLCYLWEKYAQWSRGLLPPVFNRRRCAAYWRGNTYSNKKLKDLTGWKANVPFDEAAGHYFEFIKQHGDAT